ncbi:hypothetical protein EV127DRAFT_408973 [Xylaria flabelliformis]|uniref:Uncharacterized protein n=1 Tax=Xylaria flabelliformis TaxID=2512241 RepID=A0A553I770_9PEZI|nr:hypothetical protein EV127DRAFT_408973 [Xylaria flabelliformis]TRX96052.1 hypothetical protein FHL15_003194 [Xylaria flabelliformis]
MGFFDKIQSKLELYRLEKRYTRNRHRRSTFISNAQYVDGEYVFQTPSSTGSSTNSSTVSTPTSARANERRSLEMPTVPEHPEQSQSRSKRLHRLSSMPGFGSKESRRDW